MKNIYIFTHEYPPMIGGIGTVCNSLYYAFKVQGRNCFVVAPRVEKSVDQSEVIFFKFHLNKLLRFFSALIRILFFRIKTDQDSVVIVADIYHGLACYLVSFFFRFKYRTILHGSEVLILNRIKKKIGFLPCYFCKAEKTFANSIFSKNILLETCKKCDEKKVMVNYLGVSPDWFIKPNQNKVIDIKRKYNFNNTNKKFVFTLARMDPRKGHLRVIQAINQLPADLRMRVEYICIGPTDNSKYVSEVKRIASSLDVGLHVLGRLPVDEIKAIMSVCDVFCMPGLPDGKNIEGFGLAYIEAAAQGLPVIATNVGGVSEAVLNNLTGLLIEAPADDCELSSALEKILSRKINFNDSVLLQHAKKFSWPEYAENILK